MGWAPRSHLTRKTSKENIRPQITNRSLILSLRYARRVFLYHPASIRMPFDLRTTTPLPLVPVHYRGKQILKGCTRVCGILSTRQAIRAQAALSRHPTGITSIALSAPSVRSPFSPPFTPLVCAVEVEPAAGSTGPAAGQARQVSGFSDRFQDDAYQSAHSSPSLERCLPSTP